MIDREATYQALADRIAGALGAVSLNGSPPFGSWTVTRTFKDFDDSTLSQPACVVVATEQRPVASGPGNLHAWQLDAHALVYFKARDPSVYVDTMVNEVIDAIDGSLNAGIQEPDSTGGPHTTLGGLAVRASIEGTIRIFQGLPNSQTVVIIPITMLVA